MELRERESYMSKNQRNYIQSCGITVILLIFCGVTLAATGSVTVAWDPIQDSRLGGYTVNWGLSSRTYTNSQNTSATQLTLELEAGKKYYFAVNGYDKQLDPGDISAEVSTVVNGSGNDTTPPVISKVAVGNITGSTAFVSFTTNEEAYAQVEYGTTQSLGSATGLTNDAATSNNLRLSGLSTLTTYFFRVVATDLSGNESRSAISSFKTTDGDPNASLRIIQITVSHVTSSAVRITWSTNKSASGIIQFGSGSTMNGSLAQTDPITDHSVTISGLPPSTVYRYQILASSGGVQATSGILTFKTADRVSQPAQPSPNAIFVPSVVENGNIRTNLGIDSLTDSAANVNITVVGKDGLVIAGTTVQVPARGLTQINSVLPSIASSTVGHDTHADLYLESDQPISAWASQIDNSTNDPSLLISKQNGSTQILIPSAANTSSFSSSLVIMNLGSTSAQVALKAYGIDGSVLAESHDPLSIPANGILAYDNVLQSLGVNGNYGPIEITSLNSNPLVAASRVASKNRSGGFFEGVNYAEAALTQVIPHVVDTADLRTNLGVNNVTSFDATVMVRLMNKDGQEVGALPVTVAPKGLTQINNVVRELLGSSSVANFEGYLQLESNQPIIAWVSEIDNTTNDPGFAVSKTQGARHLLVGSTANTGIFKSSLVVVNTGGQEALVDIVMHDAQGNLKGQLNGVTIPTHGFYTSQNILESLGVTGNFGPVELTSRNAQPLVVVSRVYSTSGTSGFFEGVPLE